MLRFGPQAVLQLGQTLEFPSDLLLGPIPVPAGGVIKVTLLEPDVGAWLDS